MAAHKHMTIEEMLAARRRFEQDQEDAMYVDYTFARGRIDARRRWRRDRERFLLANGYTVA